MISGIFLYELKGVGLRALVFQVVQVEGDGYAVAVAEVKKPVPGL